MTAQHLSIDLGQTGQVSALLVRPQAARACYVLAHGAGMAHHFMEEVASGLAALGSASLHPVEAADHACAGAFGTDRPRGHDRDSGHGRRLGPHRRGLMRMPRNLLLS